MSATLRKLWEARKYQYTEAKLSREKATGAHVSSIGHITANELLDTIAQIENKNGFSNPIMWIPTRRVKKIPRPEWIDWNRHSKNIDHLSQSAHMVKIERQMDWDTPGKVAWDVFYESLTTPKSGILAGLIARADPQVLRLSMLYAVPDQSSLISEVHLNAAMAFWKYAAAGAKWVFGRKTGDRMADKLFWFLNRRPAGMTRTEIAQEVFKRNAASADIERVLSILVDADVIENKPSNHRAGIYPEQTKGQNYVWITRRPSRGKSSATGRPANRTAAAYLLTCAIPATDDGHLQPAA